MTVSTSVHLQPETPVVVHAHLLSCAGRPVPMAELTLGGFSVVVFSPLAKAPELVAALRQLATALEKTVEEAEALVLTD